MVHRPALCLSGGVGCMARPRRAKNAAPPPRRTSPALLIASLGAIAAVAWALLSHATGDREAAKSRGQEGRTPQGTWPGSREALLHAARAQQWSEAYRLVSTGVSTPFAGLLGLSLAARSFASLRGNSSLAGACSGVCAPEDDSDPAFRRWLGLLLVQRYGGWQADAV